MTPPQQLAGYHLDHRIAVGGMAEIYKARRIGPEGFSKRVAVKIVLPDLCRDPSFVEMFLQEARLSAQLSSEQLIQVFDFGQEQGSYFLVMEYIDGVDLATLLSTAGALPWRLAVHISRKLGAALAYLHQVEGEDGQPLEIVHRDVTPGNILLSNQGAIKLGDFGIARWQARRVRTARGNIKGTLAYLSPEQARGDEVDCRTDLYGLGLVLFEMLTGQRYLQAEDDPALLRIAQDPPPRAPSAGLPGLPVELDPILARALNPEPARRFPRAELLEQALARLVTDQQDSALRTELGARVRESQHVIAGDGGAKGSQAPSLEQDLDQDPGREKDAPPQPPPRRTEPQRTEVVNGAPPPPSRLGRTMSWLGAAGVIALAGVGGVWWVAQPDKTATPVKSKGSAPEDTGPTKVKTTVAPADSGSERRLSPLLPDRGNAAGADRPVRLSRERRTPKVRPIAPAPRAADAAPTPPGDASSPAQKHTAQSKAKARITQLRQQLAIRGILSADAPALYRELASLAAAAQSNALSSSAVEALGDQIRSFSIDRSFIEVKLRRLNQRLEKKMKQSSVSERRRGAVQQHTSRALSFVVTGRYEEANQELNRIARLLK